MKNWSKIPQSRERTRLGNCSLLLPHGEQGRELRRNPAVDFHTQKWCQCVSGGHHPPSSDTALNHHSHTHQPWGGQGSNHISTRIEMILLCRELRDSFGRWGGDLPLVPLSHETGWVYNQRKGSQSFFFFKGAVMLVDWERSGQRFLSKQEFVRKKQFQ